MVLKLDKSGRIARISTLASSLTSEDIHAAIDRFKASNNKAESYLDSTTYDLAVNGSMYPPKAIFGLAMSTKLTTDVRSSHFSGGQNSPCFKTLERLGFKLQKKQKSITELYASYSREDICNLFDPSYNFKSGSGRWGLTGIVAEYPTENDFVFIVTLDSRDGNEYEDYLTEDGVLFWKSQNQHTPKSVTIHNLVSHDNCMGTIYLFMRVNREDDYTFFGPLSFRDWNPNSTKPVHFQWNMMSWPLPSNIYKQFSDHIRSPLMPGYAPPKKTNMVLTETPKPKPPRRNKKAGNKNSGTTNWAEREKSNRELGLAGEEAVIRIEKQTLIQAGKPDLAEKIEHIAKVNSAAGYDIKSFDTNGKPKLIEVKTTTGGKSTQFFISSNEVKISREKEEFYWIYRVYDFDKDKETGKFYTQQGAVEDNFELSADTYKAAVK